MTALRLAAPHTWVTKAKEAENNDSESSNDEDEEHVGCEIDRELSKDSRLQEAGEMEAHHLQAGTPEDDETSINHSATELEQL